MQANATVPALSRTQQLRLIREAYSELVGLNLQDGFKDVAEYLFDKNLTAERQHRKGAPYGIRHGISANIAAKLFTVEHLLEGWAEPDKWSVDAILSIRTEVLYAQAYAKRFHKVLEPWATKYAELILSTETFDYHSPVSPGVFCRTKKWRKQRKRKKKSRGRKATVRA